MGAQAARSQPWSAALLLPLLLVLSQLAYQHGASMAAPKTTQPSNAHLLTLGKCYYTCETAGKGLVCVAGCMQKLKQDLAVIASASPAKPVPTPRKLIPLPKPSSDIGPASPPPVVPWVVEPDTDAGWFKPTKGNDGKIWGKYALRGKPSKAKGTAYATYHYYGPFYETSSLYCADEFNKILPEGGYGLLEYPWVAYCWENGPPMGQQLCGTCAKITNPLTGQSVKVHIVDLCGQKGVDMDPVAFNTIDGNGLGVQNGHLWVDIDFIEC